MSNANSVPSLADLFHHRWSLPLLAVLHREPAVRFVQLLHRTGAPREPMTAALRELERLGLLVRNPGYGHPLRPEYLLPENASLLAAECAGLLPRLERRGLEGLAVRKWPLPVLHIVGGGAERFGELRLLLDPVTPRALSTSLQELEGHSLVRRSVEHTRPPTPHYRLGTAARGLIRPLEELALAFADAANP